ncbi:hypothetical protein OS493_001856 [Desmophyllum pertusum]|uniref:BEN domain-containing protein n=1 Tax=Desmophyllum pertusum TaxID=174260 RepID=A0A9X0CUW5_9CNID|nr:hypothetical protein OS493_001856 [Desmophyllum pertusum]
MVFVVVQWKEENSVSVISEKQVVLGANHELKEGLTVVVSTGKNSKGRIAVYKAVVLKVFDKKAKAIEYESTLVTKPVESKDKKRARKPSTKARESNEDIDRQDSDDDDCEEQEELEPENQLKNGNQQKMIMMKLQQSVQEDRIKLILQERQANKHITIIDDDKNDGDDIALTHTITPSTPTLPHTPAINQPPHAHTISSHTATPPHTPAANHTAQAYTPCIPSTPTTPATITNHITRRPTNFTPHTPTTPRTPFSIHSTLINPASTPLSHHMHTSLPTSFTQDLLGEDIDNFIPGPRLPCPPSSRSPANSGVGGEWESFTAHFTQEFEWLKAEVDGLRSEIKSLKKTVKELKANPTGETQLNEQHQTPKNQLSAMVQNTSKPLDGLKILLYHLFTEDEVRQYSLKGRTTVTGGETVGLEREKLELIYCAMEEKFNIERMAVENLIRGQQRKLRGQLKKKNSS